MATGFKSSKKVVKIGTYFGCQGQCKNANKFNNVGVWLIPPFPNNWEVEVNCIYIYIQTRLYFPTVFQMSQARAMQMDLVCWRQHSKTSHPNQEGRGLVYVCCCCCCFESIGLLEYGMEHTCMLAMQYSQLEDPPTWDVQCLKSSFCGI